MKDTFSLIFKGMLVGIANIIPGVSGGTMSFVLGIYPQLTEAIGYFLIRPQKRKEYSLFLLKLGIGIVLGFLLFAKLIVWLLGVKLPEGSPLPYSYVPTFGFFLGLILGSVFVLFKMQSDSKFSFKRLGLVFLGFFALLLVNSLRNLKGTTGLEETIIKDFGIFKITMLPIARALWLFLVGILAAATMIVPGISGSALLVALGEYGPILSYVGERSITPIAVIGIGFAIGIWAATLLIAKLLQKYPGATFYFILGLVIASCWHIVANMINAHAPFSAWPIGIVTVIIGFVLALQSSRLQSS